MEHFKRNKLFYFGTLILTLGYLIWFFMGDNSYILYHDNLDSEFCYIKLLVESGNALGFNLKENVYGAMNGIPRSFFRSGINLTFLWYALFSPINAHIFNSYLVHLIGFVGFYVLAIQHFNIRRTPAAMFSMVFALISHYSNYGLCTAGQPLLLYIFLNFAKQKGTRLDWILLFLFPFYNYFVMSVPFFLPIIAGIGFYYYFQTKKINKSYILAMLLFTSVSILLEFPLFYNMFFSGLVSHRQDWEKVYWATADLNAAIYKLQTRLLKTTYSHAGIIEMYPIGLALLLLFIFRTKPNTLQLILVGLFLAITLFECFFNFNLLPLSIRSFNFSRFYLLTPFILVLLMASIYDRLSQKNIIAGVLTFLVWALAIISTFKYNTEYMVNMNILFGQKTEELNFRLTMDEELFKEVLHEHPELVTEKSNALCLGIYPNIVQFNGIRTLDSYQNNFLKSYKWDFYKIIEKEIAKDTAGLYNYYTKYASRCYSFSVELDNIKQYGKTDTNKIRNLDYNFDQAKKMKATHVISAVPILNNKQIGLEMLKTYTTSLSHRRLYLYKIN